jgi:hypothetical protein
MGHLSTEDTFETRAVVARADKPLRRLEMILKTASTTGDGGANRNNMLAGQDEPMENSNRAQNLSNTTISQA